MSRWWEEYYPPSVPKKVRGGIKAQTKSGAFGKSWWARRWIEVLESFEIGARLQRGRSYARRGQVVSIEIDKGIVKSKVQGSRSLPYGVTIAVRPLSSGDWSKVASVLMSSAIFAAKLLSGEMPEDIETAFSDAKLSLFPRSHSDLKTDCSCPDWSNPCKHIAAVYYLLGEEFDRDPFLIFKLRGMTREELLSLLSESGHGIGKKRPARKPATEASEEPIEEAAEPLLSDPGRFWNGEPLSDDVFGSVQAPPVQAHLLKRLGNFPFWRGTERFLTVLEPIYSIASPLGISASLGETVDK